MSMQEKKTVIEQRLIENKGKDELCDYLREQLTDCGWKEDLKVYCKELIRNKGLDRISVPDLVEEMLPRARATVPEKAKEDLLERVKLYVKDVL